MRWNLISRVTLHKLEKDSADRRGAIASFYMKDDIKNMGCINMLALSVWELTAMLCDHFGMPETGRHGYPFTEFNDCWVNQSMDDPRAVVLRHKYWGDRMLMCFYELVRAMAVLHEWELVDERGAKKPKVAKK